VRTVLLVAAEPGELRGILRRCTRVRRLDWPLWFARSGGVERAAGAAVAHGPGRKLATEAVDAALLRERPDALASVGFCGALDASLAVGEVFVLRGSRTGARPMRRSSRIPGGRSVRAH